VAAEAARLLANQPEYGAWAWEVHHTAKKDAPSGTLLQLIEEMQRAGFTRRIDASSNRAGANPGTHEIGFDYALCPIEPMFAMHKAVKEMMEIFMREESTNAVADRLTSFEDFNKFVGLDKAVEEEARYHIK